ncbi:MAG: DUF2336 domain-containing protein [Janthinobacterium lividum]
MPAILPTLAAGVPDGAADVLLRAATRALDRARHHDLATMRELAVPDDHRPDERLRAMLRTRFAAAIAPIERDLRLGAAARLAAMQAAAAAERLLDDAEPVVSALTTLAATDDPSILADLLADVRLEALAEALPAGMPAGAGLNADQPSLLVRLVGCPEPDVAAAASELLAVQSRRGATVAPVLPPATRERLVWWTAALLRVRLGDDPRADHALVEAASDLLVETPGAVSVAAAAMRLAGLVHARPDELPMLLLEALGDRQPVLFVALLAQASGLDFEAVRAALTDVAGDRLWLLLRAQDMDRSTIARIGVALADADARRDLDRFVAALDAAMAIAPERAAAVFAAATLHPAYRAALAAVAALR